MNIYTMYLYEQTFEVEYVKFDSLGENAFDMNAAFIFICI